MRLSRLPAALVAGALLTGIVSCATTIDGTGTLAADAATGAGTPTVTASPTVDPTTASPTPAPTTATPTTNPVVTKQRLLCVLERASITSINSQFNKAKERDAQIRVLRGGASTIRGHLVRSGLPEADGVRRAGTGVLDQLKRLVTDATGGNSPTTQPYNVATQKFQTVCNKVS